MKQTTKKALRRRANLCYTGAIALGVASLMVASGVETADTFNGMIAYSLAAVAVFALTLPCVGYARHLEMEADPSAARSTGTMQDRSCRIPPSGVHE